MRLQSFQRYLLLTPRAVLQAVFDGLTVTYEDDRFDYGEQRYVTFGLLKGIVVSIVHTESEKPIRIISFRKATRNEEAYLVKSLQN